MSELNKDALYLISKVLKDDRILIYSCLLVSTTWCKVMVPTLWKFPGRFPLTKKANDILFNVIISHLSEESRNNLKNQGINIFTEITKQPLFNYISLWRYLNLELLLETMIISKNIEKSKMFIVRNEILKLFINGNTKFNYLYIPKHFDYQLNHISWAENCFSELESLDYYNITNQNVLEGLAKISKSIKKFSFDLMDNNDISGIVKLIEAQKYLNEVNILCYSNLNDESYKAVTKSLVKNAASILNLRIDWSPVFAKFLPYFVNLKRLEIYETMTGEYLDFCQVSLPILEVLRAKYVSIKFLARLIENTSGHLTTIRIFHDVVLCEDNDIRGLIQAIYQNCPYLKYVKIPFKSCNLSEFERLLINCRYLNGLIVMDARSLDFKILFNILSKSSSSSLYKFKFIFNRKFGKKLKSLKLFFDNWNDRYPILLQIDLVNCYTESEQQIMKDLIEEYKVKGIIKKFDLNLYDDVIEFEWDQKKSSYYQQ